MAASQPTQCRSCGAPVVFAQTPAGKLCPYDIVDGQATTTSHFTTCSDPKRWTKKPPGCGQDDTWNCEGPVRATPLGRLCGWHAAVLNRKEAHDGV